jgi:nucleotide-binding universal stress UspA family protein
MKQVVVAVDGSDYGVTAARAAVEMAKKCAFWDITFVHVVTLKPGQIGTEEYPQRPDLPERWPVFQEPLAIARSAGVKVRCEVLFGHAAEQLLHYSRREGIDLIVMGSLGESGIKGFFLGSVATRVVAHATCSVMVVRPGFRLDNDGS